MDRKNLLKVGRRNSLNISSRSLNASRNLAETSNYALENFGTSLPVAVIELIASSERKTECSVTLSKDGWAWFVCGRQLVIWKFSKSTSVSSAMTPSRKSIAVSSPKCHELTLPPSDLAHKSDLVAVFSSEPDSVPSCIAVSPEGTVRYWDSVAHENFFVEINADLQGQECDTLSEAMPLGCLVATTTASILLLTPRTTDGRPNIQCRNFKTPQGLLGSISRRMSSLIFGSISTHQSMETRLVKLLSQRKDRNTLEVQILCSQTLQYWLVGETERLLYQCDIDKWARDSLIAHVWSRSNAIHHLRVWVLDAQVHKSELVLLIAASNPNLNSQIQYALAALPLQTSSPPTGFDSFCVLKFATDMSERSDSSSLESPPPPQCRFVLVGSTAYLYSDKWILCVPSNEPLEEPDRLEVRAPNERFLGAGVFNQRPVFFSTRHGVLVLQPSSGGPNDSQSFIDESIMEHSHIMAETLDPAQIESTSSKLKMAFFNFCRKNVYETQTLLEDLFSSPTSKGQIDSLLDRMVVELSQKIIDDYPASDPRWTDSVPAGHESTFTTVSLLVLHQLEDKVKAHDLFLTFLRNMSIWGDLTAIGDRRGAKSSAFVLMEHAEKLRSALALRALHTPGSTLIDTAIRRVLQERAVEQTNDKLTQQDHFYRNILALGDFFPCFVDVVCETVASMGGSPSDKVKPISNAANFIVAMTNAARDYRARNIDLLEQCENSFETLPWIAAPGPRSVRSSIVRLLHLLVEEGVANADDAGLRSNLWSQAANLADILLDALKLYLDSCEENGSVFAQARQEVQSERSAILDLFLKGREFDRAALLAEKYVDFAALLTVCDETMNEDKLNVYIDKLGDSGFTEFACKWYMQRNQREKLLRLRRPEVSTFLENHPDILWVDQSENELYLEAARTLTNLASMEKDLYSRKRTLLSLAKLHLVTEEKLGPDPEVVQAEMEIVEAELALLMHQEQLPAMVLQAYDLDPNTMRVFTASELIEMYICDENVLANELDFKKALDLLNFLENPDERESRRLRIWAKAILRDAWTQFDMDNVLQSISGTIFFKIIEFALGTGEDLADLLPNPEEILQEPQLSELAGNDVFQFLLKAVYEHVNSLMEATR